jgi:hypothetical protein
MQRCPLPDFPWHRIEATQGFITDLFAGPPPPRPGVLMHLASPPAPPPPPGLTEFQRQVWTASEALRGRPLGADDWVPTLGTGAGTCAMATAFGCEESQTNGVYWVKPSIGSPEEIDRLRKPPITAGKLGWVLERTRAYAEYADPRLPIRIMDFQSPFTTVEQLLGSETFFLMPYDHPRRLHALMDLVTDFAIEFFQAQMAAAGPTCCPGIWPTIWFPKCAGIQMSDDNLVNVSPAVYEEFVLPYNNRIADAFGGLFLHSCTIREEHLANIRRHRRLTGVNCDISTSVPVARLLEVFGQDIVVAPHAYINTHTNFQNYREFMDHCLEGWRPGLRLFIHPCSVMYLPAQAREIPFNQAEVEQALAAIPGFTPARGPA